MAAEQCASACDAVMVPHCRSFPGPSPDMRCFTSPTVVASNRFFMQKVSTKQPRRIKGVVDLEPAKDERVIQE